MVMSMNDKDAYRDIQGITARRLGFLEGHCGGCYQWQRFKHFGCIQCNQGVEEKLREIK